MGIECSLAVSMYSIENLIKIICTYNDKPKRSQQDFNEIWKAVFNINLRKECQN